MIIGISGKIGSGKDLTGKIIQVLCHLKTMNIPYSIEAVTYNMEKHFSGNSYYGEWRVKKFAGKLKQVVALLTGCTVEQLEDQEFKQRKLPRDWDVPYPGNTEDVLTKPMTYREMLQKVGTEAMRDNVHTNVWVNALFADYRGTPRNMRLVGDPTHDFPNWIITDMRFPNELEAVKKHGGITIRIDRDTYFRTGNFSVSTHPSETSLDNSNFDYTIDNNGSIEDLVEKVQEILIKAKII